MRKIRIIPVILIAGLASCGGGGEKSASDSTGTTSMDTTQKAKDTTQMIAALPDIPAGARVFFKNLKDGQTISSPFKVEFGVEGIALDTAGSVKPGSGHHHLLIDAGDSIPAGQVVPKDSTHMHFGKAQTGTEIKLTPGVHELTLQYADGIHRSYGAKLAASVKVTVK